MTIKIFLTLFLPIIISCIILNLISNAQNKHLFAIAGWKGLLLTAWIGTPIHEFSHWLAAVISGHKIIEVKFFKPDSRSGSLGYISHSFNPDNIYQAVIGNTMIAIAPFFGGAVAIYLLIYLLLPEFSLYSSQVPSINYVTSENFLTWKSYVLFGGTVINFFKYLLSILINSHMFSDWKFYVFIFVLFGIANHLSPSVHDFKNFWQPLAVIILLMTLLNLIILPFTKTSMTVISTMSRYVLFAMPILLLAIFVSTAGLLVSYLFYMFISIFKK